MPPLLTMLKSYGPDLPYAVRFVRSYEQHLQDDIPLVVVVPRDDLGAFRGAWGRATSSWSRRSSVDIWSIGRSTATAPGT